jgi:acetoin:2,6-dichlorophenolindophenol oxidoreductase subunit beta
MCEAAASTLAEDGVSAEVLDLRTLVPLDAAAVLASVRRTGRVVIVEENPGQLGWGAGVAAILAEEAFADLTAPVVRVSGGNVPLPVAAAMEAAVMPSPERVVDAARRVLQSRTPQPARG